MTSRVAPRAMQDPALGDDPWQTLTTQDHLAACSSSPWDDDDEDEGGDGGGGSIGCGKVEAVGRWGRKYVNMFVLIDIDSSLSRTSEGLPLPNFPRHDDCNQWHIRHGFRHDADRGEQERDRRYADGRVRARDGKGMRGDCIRERGDGLDADDAAADDPHPIVPPPSVAAAAHAVSPKALPPRAARRDLALPRTDMMATATA